MSFLYSNQTYTNMFDALFRYFVAITATNSPAMEFVCASCRTKLTKPVAHIQTQATAPLLTSHKALGHLANGEQPRLVAEGIVAIVRDRWRVAGAHSFLSSRAAYLAPGIRTRFQSRVGAAELCRCDVGEHHRMDVRLAP